MNMRVGETVSSTNVYNYIYSLHTNVEDFEDGDITERIYQFSTYVMKEIYLTDISFDEFYFDEDVVDEYEEELNKKGSYPPIVLGYHYNKWEIIDGTHRSQAIYNKNGQDENIKVRALVPISQIKENRIFSYSQFKLIK